jgi:hypothetical protein
MTEKLGKMRYNSRLFPDLVTYEDQDELKE